jgi:hypothetical protein
MRAQITLFGVTIAFVPADQDWRAERRLRVRSRGYSRASADQVALSA